MPTDSRNRRQFLVAVSAVGALGVAGCVGDDDDIEDDPLEDDDDDAPAVDDDDEPDDAPADEPDDDEEPVDDDDDEEPEEVYEVRWGTSTGGTMDVGLAFEAAAAEVSDVVDYTTIESPGYIGTAYRLNDHEFDGGIIDTNTMFNAQHYLGDFETDPIGILPWQGFLAFPYGIYVMAREDTDIETFDDLAGANVYPAEPGFSTRATTLDLWSQDPISDVYEEMNIIDMDVADAPGAMEEGAIDAAIAYGTPGIGNTGWVVEYDARVDVRYVEHTDALVEAIEMFDGVSMSEFDDGGEAFLWDQNVGAEEFVTWDLNVTYAFHPETPDEAAYELTRIAAEEGDVVRASEARFWPENAEDCVTGFLPEYPVHPGAAEYYQEADVWEDDWIAGDRDQIGEYFVE